MAERIAEGKLSVTAAASFAQDFQKEGCTKACFFVQTFSVCDSFLICPMELVAPKFPHVLRGMFFAISLYVLVLVPRR